MQFTIGVRGFTPNTFRDPSLDLEGGDVTADDEYVYVGANSIDSSRYSDRDILGRAEVIKKIQRVTGKQLIDLGDVDFHNDRYHIPVGPTQFGAHTSVVGDIVMALKLLGAPMNVIRDAEKSKGVLELKDTVERLTTLHGIAVKRIPMLPKDFYGNKDGRYYTNVLMDWYTDDAGKAVKQVLVPHYGIRALDEAADQVYRDLGFAVTSIDGRFLGQGEGGPRCAVQVFGRPLAQSIQKPLRKNNLPVQPQAQQFPALFHRGATERLNGSA